jgi:hypothetical protein
MRHLALAILASALLVPAAAGAQSAAVAPALGRLFFSPEQRAALDERRKARLPDKPAALPPSPTTRVDGYVRRSSGKSTVWIDGQPVREGPQPEGISVRGAADPSRVTLTVTGESRRSVQMRVGETLDRGSGAVKDVIGNGNIRIERRGAAR